MDLGIEALVWLDDRNFVIITDIIFDVWPERQC